MKLRQHRDQRAARGPIATGGRALRRLTGRPDGGGRPRQRPWYRRRTGFIAALFIGATGLTGATAPLAGASALVNTCNQVGGTVSCTYTFTGSQQQFTVPAGISAVYVTAVGATGGSGGIYGAGGGAGGTASGYLGVTPGETLYVEVGGNGGNGVARASSTTLGVAGTGGFNGGGAGGTSQGGGGGGGASDVQTVPCGTECPGGPSALGSRLIVAGGGGGGGGGADSFPSGSGGSAGAGGGGGSANPYANEPGAQGGGAGTTSAGGSGGAPGVANLVLGCEGEPGSSGAAGTGGAGGMGDPNATPENPSVGGGGGGGGYFGGGGGASAWPWVDCGGAGGGGGSDFAASGVISPSLGVAVAGAAPSVTISYKTPATVYVTSGGTGTCSANSATNGLPTILAALACVTNGDTISVGPGTFQGEVTLSGVLTIEGAGAGQTTILGTAPTGGVATTTTATTPELTIAPGSDVTVRDLTVDGAGAHPGINGTTGTLSVDAVQVVNVTSFTTAGAGPSLAGGAGAIGMVPNATGGADLTVTNSTVADENTVGNFLSLAGITVYSTGSQPSQATLVNDTVTGNYSGFGAAVTLWGTNATLVNDTIDNNASYVFAGFVPSSGLYVGYQSGGTPTKVSVANSLIAGNSDGSNSTSVPPDCMQFPSGVIVNGGHNLVGTDVSSTTETTFLTVGYGCGLGNGVDGGVSGTWTSLSSAPAAGPTTSLPVVALQEAIPSGAHLTLGKQTLTTTQAEPVGATTIAVQSFTPSFSSAGEPVFYQIPADIGPLAHNGGPTETQALLRGSPAVGSGSAAVCISAPVNGLDQRGLPRNAATRGACDIGAYDTGGAPQAPVAIGTTALPNATLGTYYTANLTATAGTLPYTWSLAPGSELPAGLQLSSSTGVISGTPQAGGTTTFTVQVADSTSPTPGTASAQFSIDVLGAAPQVKYVAPSSGASSGHRYIELFGTNLAPGSTSCVWYRGAGCTGVSVQVGANKAFVIYDSPGILLVLSPPGAPGTVPITVVVDGRAAGNPAQYTYTA